MPEPTRPIAATMASVPALQANSQSAACVLGTAPIASATSVEVGLTAYGWDSDPTQTARSSCRIDLRAFHGVARRLDGHGDHVFIQAGDGFLLDREAAFAAGPDAGDFLGGQAIARHVRAIADDANRLDGFE